MSSLVVEEKIETPEEAKQFSDINEAPTEQPQIEPSELPNKFQGKSVTEIVSSYENLEKELGRKGQEIGEFRQLTDQILKLLKIILSSGSLKSSKKCKQHKLQLVNLKQHILII